MILFFLVVYSIGLIALGAWITRRVRASGDFFVSGRSLGAGLIFATFLAPNIGAGSTVGATDLAYREGLSAWWWNGSAGIGSLAVSATAVSTGGSASITTPTTRIRRRGREG